MIRLFVLLGVVSVVGIAYLTTLGMGPDLQKPPAVSQIARFQAAGLVPDANAVSENEEVEHGIFRVPPEDEEMLEAAMADGGMAGMDMGAGNGMNMNAGGNQPAGGMDMNAGNQAGDNMNMNAGGNQAGGEMNMNAGEQPAGGMDMNAGNQAGGNMDMNAGGNQAGGEMNMNAGEQPAGGMNMAEGGDQAAGGMNMAQGEMAQGDMPQNGEQAGGMAMKEEMSEEEAEAAMAQQMAGLVLSEDGAFDREIKLEMTEWGYSQMQINVKQGERIKFTMVNAGKIPHEFMFMTMPAMAAINYRAQRADWSLLEHEALYEKSLILPGGEFSFVAAVTKPGNWMFMCMLPYHMQMGMMGQMATDGNFMQMQM